jgi:endonuclease/exonuclease/phosphatase family metal-dependent hydrolase
MLRVLSYNILVGGTRRVEQLTKIIRSQQPDIVGLVEATDPQVVEELAGRLGMEFCLTGHAQRKGDWQLAVLSHLPIVQTKVHSSPIFSTRQHLLEVSVEEPGGTRLTVFVVHLTASFMQRVQSNRIRREQVQEILHIMAPHEGQPHLLMGDFNSVVPGEPVKGSNLLRYFLREGYHSYRPRSTFWQMFIETLLHTIVRNKLLSAFVDMLSPIYAKGGIDLLLQAGYIDCFRRIHPHGLGFTFSSSIPAGRIDFIFASPELAQRLVACDVITEGEGVRGEEASDHLPVYVEFAEGRA